MPKNSLLKPSDLLRDMRHVYRTPASADVTEGQKKNRALYDDDPNKFMDRLQRVEEAHRQRTEAAREKDKPGVKLEEYDDGSEASLELIKKLLLEKPWEKEDV